MANKEQIKQKIIGLINMDIKKIKAMDEDQLMKTIAEVDQIRTDAVKDGRFLGTINRRGKREAKIEANEGRSHQFKKVRCQKQTNH